jgi:mycofactocin system glycosyltransferase
MSTGPAETRVPDGLALRLAATTRLADGGRTLLGGSPTRLFHLRPSAARLVGRGFTVDGERTARLARLLLDRGLVDATPAAPRWRPEDVTVVVPVKDRPDALARLLTALPRACRVVVVDDGSRAAGETAAVCLAAGALVLRHPVARGPAAARNTGLAQVRTPLVAFVDSDIVPRPGFLEPLLAQLTDPAVGVVAPRIAALAGGSSTTVGEAAHGRPRPPWLRGAVARYEAARSSLDLGPEPSLVVPRGRVAYLPSACLVARVDAIGDGFDEEMHVGEDVDLVWRTVAAGWRVRYEPGSVVEHEHRVAVQAWLARKAFYGTSAAPLALRHGDAVAPLVASPWTASVGVALLMQRRWAVAAGVAVTVVSTYRLSRQLHRSDRPLVAAARLAPYGVVSALWQLGAAATRHWWPVALPAALVSRRVRRAVLAAAVVDGVADWRRTRPALDPVRHTALRRLDDLAYGAGLWWGAWQHRTTAPLRPSLRASAGSRPGQDG